VQPKRLPLRGLFVGASAARKPREVAPTTNAWQAMAMTAAIAKQMALGPSPYGIGQVHRERLGHEPSQVRRGVEVGVGRVLQPRSRQPEPIAHSCGIRGTLVVCRPVGLRARTRTTLERALDLVCTGEHRLDPAALKRIARVEREPQHGHAVVGVARPRRGPIRTAGPLSRRLHHRILRHGSDDDDPTPAYPRRAFVAAARRADPTSDADGAPARPAVVLLASPTRTDRVRRAAHEPDRPRARRRGPALEVGGPSHRHCADASTGSARSIAVLRSPGIVGPRRHARSDSRSCVRCSVQELPLVMQRAGPRAQA